MFQKEVTIETVTVSTQGVKMVIQHSEIISYTWFQHLASAWGFDKMTSRAPF